MSNLKWGGVDCQELAEKFGTPLYVYDTSIIKSRCQELRDTFINRWENTRVRYASKAFLTRSMAKLIENEGIGLDVVSLGELYTALSAGFPAERIEMNGNAKSHEEINYAVKNKVGRIIVDHPDELKIIEKAAKDNNRIQKILIRVAPGVDAHTHKYISTGQTDSKFGMPFEVSENSMLVKAIKYAMSSENLDLRGLHFHVGSQLFDPDDHVKSLEKIIEVMKELKEKINFTTHELNFGGGFGAVINPSVPSVKSETFTEPMMKLLHENCKKYNLEIPRAVIEPGRWIISEAGITLYKVENIKELPKMTYIAVDGGMADNPRFALYQAEYEAVAVKDPAAPAYDRDGGTHVNIVGKCCESGDILIDGAKIMKLEAGDIIAIYNSGAYTFSMSSTYNKLQRPAVIFVENGNAKLVVERQSLEDIIRGDLL
ncbi:MAG: diaminopimelate decarboxylase [Synergistaceae bacterium]|nr:diaminopimelate decarboxylase [Synergistaceae bacterium]MBR0253839.1 diaminopimelate decarboxylase [Synergistaceae bacterium]